MRGMPRALVATSAIPYEDLDNLVHDHLVRELHTYPHKNQKIARILYILGGFLGIHRFYLGQTGYGILMLFSVGGAFIWWIVDGFKLKKMVDDYNQEQDARQAKDLPPIGMDYVPVATPDALLDYPSWADNRLQYNGKPQSRRRLHGEVFADFLALMFFGFVLGAIASDTGYRMGVWAVVTILLMINFVDNFIPLHQWPIVKGMIRWDYRLRLFYHFNEPGRRWQLYFRPIIGLFYAPFNQKARSEVLLYLELGSVFIAARALFGLLGGETWTLISSFDIEGFIGSWVQGTILGFFTIYGFAAPIGAIMMKHVLLRRKNYVRWGLSLVALFFLLQGFLGS